MLTLEGLDSRVRALEIDKSVQDQTRRGEITIIGSDVQWLKPPYYLPLPQPDQHPLPLENYLSQALYNSMSDASGFLAGSKQIKNPAELRAGWQESAQQYVAARPELALNIDVQSRAAFYAELQLELMRRIPANIYIAGSTDSLLDAWVKQNA